MNREYDIDVSKTQVFLVDTETGEPVFIGEVEALTVDITLENKNTEKNN